MYTPNTPNAPDTPPPMPTHLYFAQHQIQEHIPSLASDIEACPAITNYMKNKNNGVGVGAGVGVGDINTTTTTTTTTTNNNNNSINTAMSHSNNIYRVNLWMSRSDCRIHSPCHTDPYENLLCQMVGSKRVLLFAPTQAHTRYMQVHGGKQQNTSTIDFNQVGLGSGLGSDSGLVGYECVLDAGDALYIPFKWWHYCQSIDVGDSNDNDTNSSHIPCISVNYWWI